MSTAVASPPKPQQTAQPQPGGLVRLKDTLERSMPKLKEVALAHMSPERLVRLVLAAGSRDPKIAECTLDSVLLFTMKCAETGLEPIGAGGMWPIPRKNGKTKAMELTALPDYRGLVHCAKRAGAIVDAWPEVVRERDSFDYRLGLDPQLEHTPARGDRGALEAAYCVLLMPNGARRFVVMDANEIHACRARSQSWQGGGMSPWKTDEAEMWKKTVVRRAMKPFIGFNASLDSALNTMDEAEPEESREPVPMPQAISAPETAEQLAEGEIDRTQPAPEAVKQEIRALIAQKKVDEKAVAALLKEVGAKKIDALTIDQADAMGQELQALE